MIFRGPDGEVLTKNEPSGLGLINDTKVSPSLFTIAKSSWTIISRNSAVFNDYPNTNIGVYTILPKLSSDALNALLSCIYVTAPGNLDSLVSLTQLIIAVSLLIPVALAASLLLARSFVTKNIALFWHLRTSINRLQHNIITCDLRTRSDVTHEIVSCIEKVASRGSQLLLLR